MLSNRPTRPWLGSNKQSLHRTQGASENQRHGLAVTRKAASFQLGKHGEFPAYALSNLSGNIAKQRQRLAEMEARSGSH